MTDIGVMCISACNITLMLFGVDLELGVWVGVQLYIDIGSLERENALLWEQGSNARKRCVRIGYLWHRQGLLHMQMP